MPDAASRVARLAETLESELEKRGLEILLRDASAKPALYRLEAKPRNPEKLKVAVEIAEFSDSLAYRVSAAYEASDPGEALLANLRFSEAASMATKAHGALACAADCWERPWAPPDFEASLTLPLSWYNEGNARALAKDAVKVVGAVLRAARKIEGPHSGIAVSGEPSERERLLAGLLILAGDSDLYYNPIFDVLGFDYMLLSRRLAALVGHECRDFPQFCSRFYLSSLVAMGELELTIEGPEPRLLVKTDDGRLLEPDVFVLEILARSNAEAEALGEALEILGREASRASGGLASVKLARQAVLMQKPDEQDDEEIRAVATAARRLARFIYSRRGSRGLLDLMAAVPGIERSEAWRGIRLLAEEIRERVESEGLLGLAKRYPPRSFRRLLASLDALLGSQWLAAMAIAERSALRAEMGDGVLRSIVKSVGREVRAGLAAQLGVPPGSIASLKFLAGAGSIEPVPRVAPGERPPSLWPARVKPSGVLVALAGGRRGSPATVLFAPSEQAPMVALDPRDAKAVIASAGPRRRGRVLVEAFYVAAVRAALAAGGRVERVPGSTLSIVTAGDARGPRSVRLRLSDCVLSVAVMSRSGVNARSFPVLDARGRS